MKKNLTFEPVELSAILKVLIPALDEHGYSMGLKNYGDHVRGTAENAYSNKIDTASGVRGTLPRQ